MKTILFVILTVPSVFSLPNTQTKRRFNEDFKTTNKELLPYNFMYNHNDGHGTMQHREENKNVDGVVRGSYGYRDPSGIYRHVSYVADADGFHAVLRSNEPGIENRNSADVAVVVQSPLGVAAKAAAAR